MIRTSTPRIAAWQMAWSNGLEGTKYGLAIQSLRDAQWMVERYTAGQMLQFSEGPAATGITTAEPPWCNEGEGSRSSGTSRAT
ncbi:MAG: hypothetical protein ACOVLK_09205 [Terrimicrobiaceae bacterium]